VRSVSLRTLTLFLLALILPLPQPARAGGADAVDLAGTGVEPADLDGFDAVVEFASGRALSAEEKAAVHAEFIASVRRDVAQKKDPGLGVLREMIRQVRAAQGQSYAGPLRGMLRDALVQSMRQDNPSGSALMAILEPPPAGFVLQAGTLSKLVLPDAFLVVTLNVRKLVGSPPLGKLWHDALAAEPQLGTQLEALEGKFGLRFGQDIDAVVLSSSPKASVLAAVGRFSQAKLLQAAGAELAMKQDPASPVPLFVPQQAQGQAVEPVALAFPGQAVLFGQESGVRAALKTAVLPEAATLAVRGEHLASVALVGLDQLQAAMPVPTPVPGTPQDPSALVFKKLSSLTAALDLEDASRLAIEAVFTGPEPAAAAQFLFRPPLEQAAAQLGGGVAAKVAAEGPKLGLSFEVPAQSTGLLLQELLRSQTAERVSLPRTAFHFQLPTVPRRWKQDKPDDTDWRLQLAHGPASIWVSVHELQPADWTLEKEAEKVKTEGMSGRLISVDFVDVEGTRLLRYDADLENNQGKWKHRTYKMIAHGSMYWLAGGSAVEDFAELGEDVDFVAARLPQEANAAPGANFESNQRAFLALMQEMNRSHEAFMTMSGMLRAQHDANMAIIGNIGGNTTYRYEWRYEPH
jgi:hypothetical protein